jgi:hypothetical protein
MRVPSFVITKDIISPKSPKYVTFSSEEEKNKEENKEEKNKEITEPKYVPIIKNNMYYFQELLN